MLREEAIADDADCDCFQYSKGFFCEYDCNSHSIMQLKMNCTDVKDDDVYIVALESCHYKNMEESLGLSIEEVEKNGHAVQLAGLATNVLEEYLANHEFVKNNNEPRLIIHA